VAFALLANLPNGRPIRGAFSRKRVELKLQNRRIASHAEALSWNARHHRFVRFGAAHVNRGGAALGLRHFAEIVIASR
jgi:hypothetical protein